MLAEMKSHSTPKVILGRCFKQIRVVETAILRTIYTLFLFTKSDIKTTLMPIVSRTFFLHVLDTRENIVHRSCSRCPGLLVSTPCRRIRLDLASSPSVYDFEPIRIDDGVNRRCR